MKMFYLKYTYLRTPIFIRLIIAVPIAMTIFGVLIHFIEPETFPTIFEGVWWTFVTASTVGYGDYVPNTLLGKLAGIFLILSGGGLIAFFITSISAAAIKHEHNLGQGKVAFKGGQHYIFIGWNERTKEVLEQTKEIEPKQEFVIIDRTMEKFPLEHYSAHFIKGDASIDKTLELASVATAKAVIITADPGIEPHQADSHTILSAIAIRGNNPTVRIIAELLTEHQLENARRAGVTTLIRTDHCISSLFFHEMHCSKHATPFQDLSYLLSSQQFQHEPVKNDLSGRTYSDLLALCKEQDKLLIAIIREDRHYTNPPADFRIQRNDVLVLIVPR